MLDNRLVARYFPLSYYLAMSGKSFRDRLKEAMETQGVSKAELSRQSGVSYHTIDKLTKRENATTGADNARALANALGIKVDDDREYEELRELYYQLDEDKREFLLQSIRGLLA